MRTRRLDHVGIAVESDEQARQVLEGIFGLEKPSTEVVEDQGVRTLIYQVGDAKVELLVPLDDEGPIARHLAKRGAGLHHIAFEVDDLEEAIEHARGQGLETIGDEPQAGVEGTRIAFLHPRGTFRTLVELVEFPDHEDGRGGP